MKFQVQIFGILSIALLGIFGCGTDQDRDGTKSVSIDGEIETLVGDEFSAHETKPLHFLRSADGTRKEIENVSSQASAGKDAPKTGVLSLAVILFNYQNEQSQPWTKEEVQTALFDGPESAQAYFEQASFGKFSIAGDVFDWQTLPEDQPESCDPFTLLQKVVENTHKKIDYQKYGGVMLAFPPTCKKWQGLGSIGKVRVSVPGLEEDLRLVVSWINGVEDFRLVATHEIGHNLGLQHANGLDCGKSPIAESCKSIAYADAFDVMGFVKTGIKLKHFNVFHKEKLGWLEPESVLEIKQSGEYVIGNIEKADSKIALLKIQREDGTWYYVETRSASSFEPEFGDPTYFVDGVLIRYVQDELMSGGQSHLLDMSAADTHRIFVDAALLPGQVFYESTSGLFIQPLSSGSSNTRVFIGLGIEGPIPGITAPVH